MRPVLAYQLGGALIFLMACADDGAGNPTTSGGAGGVSGVGGSTGGAPQNPQAGSAGGGTSGGAGGQLQPPIAGTVGTGGEGGSGSSALSFEADIWPVFNQTRNPPFDYRGLGTYAGCTAASPCHGSGSPGAGLSMMNSSTAYGALVNVASRTSLCATAGGTIRVVPGDPDRSCLVQFYLGRLKDDLQWVDQAEIDLVRRWIAQGARP